MVISGNVAMAGQPFQSLPDRRCIEGVPLGVLRVARIKIALKNRAVIYFYCSV